MTIRIRALAVLLLWGLFAQMGVMNRTFAAPTLDAGAADIVMTTQGAVQGAAYDTYRTFLGIPYAAAPVGSLRWKSPQPAASWQGVRDATTFNNRCPQFASPLLNEGGMNEDCLYLNVYTPPVTDRPLPVMVWLHGGTYVLGAGNDYDGSVLAARHQAIIVTVNYRLGPFGFLALRGLRTARGSSGNYGLEDQQAALRWVQSNISAFGGDPGNVTLFGESAGAGAVCMQIMSPLAAGLFHKAIMESAPCASVYLTKPRAFAESFGREFAKRPGLRCTGNPSAIARCMRSKSTEEIMAAMNIPERYAVEVRFWPVVDGVVLPTSPPVALRRGHFNSVPVIVGTNRDEGRLLIAIAADDVEPPIDLSNDNYIRGATAVVEQTVPGLRSLPALIMPIALQFYPLRQYPAPEGYDPEVAPAHLALSALLTDLVFSCNSSLTNSAFEKVGMPTYAYEFQDPGIVNPIESPYMPIAAGHTVELPFVFQTPIEGGNINPLPAFTADQYALSDQMQTYWTNFAATGDPNVGVDPAGPVQPYWPVYSESSGAQRLQFAPGADGTRLLDEKTFSSEHHCQILEPLLRLFSGIS
jgi:para-nitrobenzyl esterase